MKLPEKIADFGWYGAGWAVFKGGAADPDFYPPVDDAQAQREWLAGFHAAWVECPDDEAMESILYGDGMGGESLEEALADMLSDKQELLRALWGFGLGKIGRVIH